jgi:hypothetical protein
MAGWSFTSVHHSQHSRNGHSPKWWMFTREYNSWRALCPPLAAEALTPIWMYLNYIQVPVPIYANDMCHQCSVSVSPKWPAASRSTLTCGHGSPRAWLPLSWWWCAKAWPHWGHHHQSLKPMLPLFSIQQKHVSCSDFACVVSLRYVWYGVQNTGIEDENLAKIARDYFSLDSDNNLQQQQ